MLYRLSRIQRYRSKNAPAMTAFALAFAPALAHAHLGPLTWRWKASFAVAFQRATFLRSLVYLRKSSRSPVIEIIAVCSLLIDAEVLRWLTACLQLPHLTGWRSHSTLKWENKEIFFTTSQEETPFNEQLLKKAFNRDTSWRMPPHHKTLPFAAPPLNLNDTTV